MPDRAVRPHREESAARWQEAFPGSNLQRFLFEMREIVASPSTRRLARQAGVDLETLSRELGREEVTRRDVEEKLAGGRKRGSAVEDFWGVDHAAWGSVSSRPASGYLRSAAARLAASQQWIPAVTHHDRADLGKIEQFRSRLRDGGEGAGTPLTALAFHVRALAATLGRFPVFNSSLSADGGTLWLKQYVHVGIAVDAPHGLVLPVIRDADRKGLLAIAAEITELAVRARARSLRSDEMGGASMSISSLGGMGGQAFTPMINPPEVAILGISRAEIVPVWDGAAFQPRRMIPLDLTYDHRVINGADAARFMAQYRQYIEDPAQILLAR